MTTARRYTMEQIETARKKLRSLPAKTVGKTRGEVAELLVNDIKKAMRQGYTLHDIRELLKEAGVAASLTRMREVLTQSDGAGRQCSARWHGRRWATGYYRRNMKRKGNGAVKAYALVAPCFGTGR